MRLSSIRCRGRGEALWSEMLNGPSYCCRNEDTNCHHIAASYNLACPADSACGWAQVGRYLIPATVHSWAVAAFADPNYGDLDIPENPGSLHVRAAPFPSTVLGLIAA